MKYSESQPPKHGFFVGLGRDDTPHLMLFGQGGTCNSPSQLSSSGNGIALSLRLEDGVAPVLIGASNYKKYGQDMSIGAKVIDFKEEPHYWPTSQSHT